MQENLKLSEQRDVALDASRGLRAAQRSCEQIARREAKNFYWGFISLPHDQRMAIYALYDFARRVDDEADVRVGPNLHERLDSHRRSVSDCVRGRYSDDVTHVLASAIQRYGIPESELQELIDGVEMDSYQTRYATWEELRAYCRLVASIVGRMCVRIFGYSDPTALIRADELGLALQITNILRDIREDAERDRLYLPAEELARFDIVENELMRGAPGDGWPALVALEVQRARGYYASGLRVVDYIPGRAAVCVSTMAGIYERILDKIESDPWLPLRARTSLSHIEKLHVMVGSWLRVG